MINLFEKAVISKSFISRANVLVMIVSFATMLGQDNQLDSVSHKNLQLDLYLDLIRYNSQEKMGILPYILENPNGTYLEIGTGGDPIAEMLTKLPSKAQTTLIASDIEDAVLKALPLRHPELQKYIDAKSGIKLRLQQLNATDMSVFESNTLDGINASSVLHEIISYAGGFEGMENFFKESFRTLKPGGMLVYRDPESVPNKFSVVTVNLKNKPVRLFSHVFLYKFLDERGSFLAQSGRKLQLYKKDEVSFRIYKKNEAIPVSLTYGEYLDTPSYDIDFSRNFSITLPSGLYRDLARHYITYLHQCNPLLFVKCSPDISSGCYIPNFLSHSTVGIFKNFVSKKNWDLEDSRINAIQKNELELEIANNMQVLEFGIPLEFASKVKEGELRSLLKGYGFNPATHIIQLNSGESLLDYRIFGILYDEINKYIFDRFNKVVQNSDEEHAKWLKREGEEFYFYYSPDEIITKVLEITLLASMSNNTSNKEYYVLCPLSEKHNKFIDRLCYTEVLNTALEVYDDLGYAIDVKDGKRIIHFSKMKLHDALDVCKKIIKEKPMDFPKLQAWVDAITTQERTV